MLLAREQPTRWSTQLPPFPPLTQGNPQFQPSRLQEGINLGPFDAADEKWCKKAPWRCPAGSRPSGLQRLYAHHSLVTRLVACLCPPPSPSPYFPNTSCCPLHTGHVKRQHLHPVPFCSVPLCGSHSTPAPKWTEAKSKQLPLYSAQDQNSVKTVPMTKY